MRDGPKKQRTAPIPAVENLTARIPRRRWSSKGYFSEKMYGGIAFMIGRRMRCGVIDDELVSLGPDGAEKALQRSRIKLYGRVT